jgi:hypothetical protein
MLSAENTARLQALRAKALAGTATLDELREGVTILRADRVSAQVASTTGKANKAAAAAPVDTGAVLANLKALGAKLASGPVQNG